MIRFLLNIYLIFIFADALISWFPAFRNESWAKFINQIAGYTLNPIRKILPNDLPFDLSHAIVAVLILLLPSLW